MKTEKPETNKVKESKTGFNYLIYAFSEAFNITASLVFFPIVFVLLGVLADKTLNTKPLFIMVGIILGVVVGVWQAIKTVRERKI